MGAAIHPERGLPGTSLRNGRMKFGAAARVGTLRIRLLAQLGAGCSHVPPHPTPDSGRPSLRASKCSAPGAPPNPRTNATKGDAWRHRPTNRANEALCELRQAPERLRNHGALDHGREALEIDLAAHARGTTPSRAAHCARCAYFVYGGCMAHAQNQALRFERWAFDACVRANLVSTGGSPVSGMKSATKGVRNLAWAPRVGSWAGTWHCTGLVLH